MPIQKLDLNDPDTAEELWALQHAAYRKEAELIGVAALPPLQDTVQSLRNCGETFHGCFGEEGELIGAVATEEESDGKRTICRVMVHPEHFRKGIASGLLRHILSEAPAGCEWSVTAEIRNVPAIQLYRRHGFEPQETFQPAPDITMLRLTRRPG